MQKQTYIAGIPVVNRMVAASCPLTESLYRVQLCEKAGFGAAILKSCADYTPREKFCGRKVVYESNGYYADSSCEREIATLQDGLSLYRQAKAMCRKMVIIPSVSVFSLNPVAWKDICRKFAMEGAKLIQLDFFYLGSLLHDENFYDKLAILLGELAQEDYIVMPKVNVNFDGEKIMRVLKDSKIRIVSLLDSIRKAAPDKYGMHPETTSFFGGFQLPITKDYLKVAKLYGLEVCCGGGVEYKTDVDELISLGADSVQIASYVLNNGFASLGDLWDVKCDLTDTSLMHRTWCDVEDGARCEGCGACLKNSNR